MAASIAISLSLATPPHPFRPSPFPSRRSFRSMPSSPLFTPPPLPLLSLPFLSPTCSVLSTRTTPSPNNSAIASEVLGKPTVLVAEKLGDAGLELLKRIANVDCSYNLSPEELCAKISLCDALIVRSGTKVSREVFEASNGRLKVVGRAGVGIDNVDLQAATEFGCLVVNAPTANTVAAAEHGIALLAAMARNIPQASVALKAGIINLPSISARPLVHFVC